MPESIKLTNYALDEIHGHIIVRGVVDPGSLQHLLVGDYQREILPSVTINTLAKAFDEGAVPDVELGMRGDRMMERSGFCYLQDEVYIVDGLQRVTAGRLKVERGDAEPPHLGAIVYIGTTDDWERSRFRTLNQERNRLSPNVLLRNGQHDYPVMEMLHRLSTSDRHFVMFEKVSWNQRMKRDELISAAMFVKTIGRLHAHLGPTRGQKTDELMANLQKLQEAVGINVLRDNVRTFFTVIDEAWGIRRVVYKENAIYFRLTFLHALAKVFSEHLDFWDGNRLVVSRDIIRKLSLFGIHDPSVVQLASSSGMAREVLFQTMLIHINSGRRTRRLRPRNFIPDFSDEGEEESSSSEDEAIDETAVLTGG